MIPLTSQGKEFAIQKLQERREANKDQDWEAKNSSLPAGSPMYFGCKACNARISVPENYVSKPSLCSNCHDLEELGWLI